jgi:hypothetical protein
MLINGDSQNNGNDYKRKAQISVTHNVILILVQLKFIKQLPVKVVVLKSLNLNKIMQRLLPSDIIY